MNMSHIEVCFLKFNNNYANVYKEKTPVHKFLAKRNEYRCLKRSKCNGCTIINGYS